MLSFLLRWLFYGFVVFRRFDLVWFGFFFGGGWFEYEGFLKLFLFFAFLLFLPFSALGGWWFFFWFFFWWRGRGERVIGR